MIKLLMTLTTFIGIYTGLSCGQEKINVTIMEKITGATAKVLLMLPIIILIIITIKWIVKKNNIDLEKRTGISSILSIILILTDLFYSSLIILKEDIKGKIINTGWLKIIKIPTIEEKELWISRFREQNEISEELWRKISKINLDKCHSYKDILASLENNVDALLVKPIINENKVLNWICAHPILIVTLSLASIGIAYYFKENLTSYVTTLSENILKIIKQQIELGKLNYISFENDKTMAEVMIQMQLSISNNSKISET